MFTQKLVQVFIAALFIVAKKRKQLKCPSTDEQINKMSYIHIHTMEYYSVFKKDEVLIHATIWLNLDIK